VRRIAELAGSSVAGSPVTLAAAATATDHIAGVAARVVVKQARLGRRRGGRLGDRPGDRPDERDASGSGPDLRRLEGKVPSSDTAVAVRELRSSVEQAAREYLFQGAGNELTVEAELCAQVVDCRLAVAGPPDARSDRAEAMGPVARRVEDEQLVADLFDDKPLRPCERLDEADPRCDCLMTLSQRPPHGISPCLEARKTWGPFA
jgi:hypothetical protein